MRKKENKLEYSCSGELIACNDNTVFVQYLKRGEIQDDNVSIDNFMTDLEEFCRQHEGEEVRIKLSAVSKTE